MTSPQDVFDLELAAITKAPTGRVAARLATAALNLAPLVHAGHLDRDAVVKQLVVSAVSSGLAEGVAKETVGAGLGDISDPHAAIPPAPAPAYQIDIAGGELPRNVEDAESALIEYQRRGFGPMIYQRGGRLCRVVRIPTAAVARGLARPAGSLAIVDVDADFLVLRMTDAACFRRYVERTEDWRVVNAPRDVALGLLAKVGEWQFSTLAAIVEAPTLRPDGSLLDRPGYDGETGILFDAGGAGFGEIPANPALADAQDALGLLGEVLAGFPFRDAGTESAEGMNSASFAVAVSAILTALVRPSLRAAPLFAFTAPTMGTGKSLLADVVSMIATGRTAAVMPFCGDRDEERKRWLAVLLAGTPIVSLDNVEVPLASDVLSSILTQEVYSDRMLGANRNANLPTAVTVTATGNNLVIKGDLATRAIVCRLDACTERPEERRFDVDLHAEVPRRRAELVRAALTIMRAYVIAGRPPQNVKPFGRFEAWSSLVRDALVWLGLADPCASRDAVAKADPTAGELARLLGAWEACFGSTPATVAAAIATANGDGSEAARLRQTMEAFAEHGTVNGRRLGRFIAKHQGRIIDGLSFSPHGDTRMGTAWAIRQS